MSQFPDELTDQASEQSDQQAAGTPQAGPAGGTGADQAAAVGQQAQGAATQAAADALFSDADISALPPEHQARLKAMQADYTRKTQAVADQRRGLDSEAQQLAWVKELAQLAQTDPEAARTRLHAMGDTLVGGQQPAPGGGVQQQPGAFMPPGLPLPEWNAMTDTERFFAATLMATTQQLQALQAQTGRQVAEVQHQFEDRALEAEMQALKAAYPGVDQNEVLQVMARYDGMAAEEAIWLTPSGRRLNLDSFATARQHIAGQKEAATIGPGAGGSTASAAAMTMDEAWERAGKQSR